MKNVFNIPKRIWTFWNSKKLPITVENCINTWKFMNPDYEIIILNTKNVNKWIPDVKVLNLTHSKESFARLSDFIRLNVLYKYGGIWLDASTICTQSFDEWFKNIKGRSRKKIDFIGFYIKLFTNKKRYPVIESWAFACVKHSKFVKKWRNEFMKLNDYEDVDDYLDHVENDLGVDFQLIPEFDDPNYLAIHISAQKVLQYDKHSTSSMLLFKAEDGPLNYRLTKPGKLSVKQRVNRLCKNYERWAKFPIVKFTGEDRKVMEKNKKIRDCVFKKFKCTVIDRLTGIKT